MGGKLLIEKGIPIPPQSPGARSGPKRRWPFREMEPYDSFYLPTDSPERSIRLVYLAATRVGARVAVRSQPGGIRVWRLPDVED